MGLTPDYLPDFKAVAEANGLDAMEMLKQAEAGKIKALYIVGENPVVSYPGRQQTEAALKNLDLLVVQDMFLSDTAKMADVVLPAASFAEKEGTFTNADRYIQKLKPALNPPGEAKADLEIIQALSNKLGFEMSYESSRAVMNEIGKQVSLYAGIELGKMNGKGVYWPVSEGEDLYSGGFENKAKLTPIDLPEVKNSTSGDFPYILAPGVTKFHSGSFSLACSDLLGLGTGEQVYLNATDAAALNLADGDAVKISTPNGTIDRVVEISDAPPPGVVYLPYHHSENGIAYLTGKDETQTVVKLEKV
jgi:predicted molibdopterin-dependent oxidoreductase YjgC